MLNKENLALLIEYTELEIKILIREAFKGLLQIYTIDNENNFFSVPIAKLQEIYTNQPSKIEVTFRFSTRHRGQTLDFGSWRNIGMSDLILDKKIADNIIASTTAQTETVLFAQNIEILEEEGMKEDEEETTESPKDRDTRLIKRAAEIILHNPKLKVSDIQKQLLTEERTKSMVSNSILRKIISKRAIKHVLRNPESIEN
ncbi:MAG: hypothetical protein ABI597_03895 [Gammaproteobacteria bacterium]